MLYTGPHRTAHRDQDTGPGYRTRMNSNQNRNRSDTARQTRPQTRPDDRDRRIRDRI